MQHVSDTYFPGEAPDDINGGDCYNWAWVAKLHYPKAQLWQTLRWGGHCWLKLGDKFYDAENPKGTTSLCDIMPETKRFKQSSDLIQDMAISPKEFLKIWKVFPQYKKRLRKVA